MRWTVTVLLVAVCVIAFSQEAKPQRKLDPYYPTPDSVVDRMLKLGALKRGEKMFDLGSGDGRIVIMSAQKYGAIAAGVELDEKLWKQSTQTIRSLGLQNTARIIFGDVMTQDYSQADLITVYLLPATIAKLRPILEKQLRKGTRVVSHDFEFLAWKPEKTEVIDDDGEGSSHSLFLYRM